MFGSITSVFKQFLEGNDLNKSVQADPKLAIASLLYEVSRADQNVEEGEQQAQLHLLQGLLDIDAEQAKQLLTKAADKVAQSASLYDFTSQLRALDQERRYELIEAMWRVANVDNVIDPLEDAVIRKAAELLYVDHSQFIRAKLAVTESNDTKHE